MAAEHISGSIEETLLLKSLQDREHSDSQQQQISGSVSMGPNSVSGSFNLGKTTLRSDRVSVQQQTGLFAGDAGFRLKVGHTHQEGSMIVSSQPAIDADLNLLETGSYSQRPIKNYTNFQAQQMNLGVGFSKNLGQGQQLPLQAGNDLGVGKNQQGEVATGSQQVPGSRLPNLKGFSANLPIVLGASGSAHSITESGVSGRAIKITNAQQQWARTGQTPEQAVAGINGDMTSGQDKSNALPILYDQQKIAAGFAIVRTLTRGAGTFLENQAKEIDAKKAKAKALEARAEDVSQPLSSAERQVLQHQANQLLIQAEKVQKNWGPGGHCRQISTALLAGISGNIAAGTGVFIQGAVVNYVQQNLAQEVGNLVAAGSLTEGSPLHASLHAIIAGAGAAASGQAITSAAAGSAATSLLTNLFETPTPETTEEERAAKRHLISTLVSGLTAAAGGDVTAANTAALANVDNNWLGSEQIAQLRQELSAAETLGEEMKVIAKWSLVSCEQDLITMSGIADGVVDTGLQNLAGLVDFIRDPIAGLDGIRNLISNPEVRVQVGEHLHDYLIEKIDNITTALREGGRENAWQLGHDIGEVTTHAVSAVTGAYGAAKGCAALAKVGIKVGSGSIKAAKALHAMKASVAVEKVGEAAARLPGNIAQGSRRVAEIVKKGLRPGATQHRVVNQKRVGIDWNAGISERGYAWENYYATQVSAESRLPAGFKVYDFYDKTTGVATSAKSLETTTAAKLANPKQIYYTMKSKMIDPIIDFQQDFRLEIGVRDIDIVRRELQLAIPHNTNPMQWEQINRGIDYAKLNGVHVEVTLIKP